MPTQTQIATGVPAASARAPSTKGLRAAPKFITVMFAPWQKLLRKDRVQEVLIIGISYYLYEQYMNKATHPRLSGGDVASNIGPVESYVHDEYAM